MAAERADVGGNVGEEVGRSGVLGDFVRADDDEVAVEAFFVVRVAFVLGAWV